MNLEIDFNKSLEENASHYYELSKKAAKKLTGVKKALVETEKKLQQLEKKEFEEEKNLIIKKRPRQWYEKFHWFKSSDGYLVIAGKDAHSNEVLVKKYMEKTDIYFHADIYGAAHTIVKSKDNSAPEKTLREAAQFAAVFSSAWREKLSVVDVYSVKPEQVSKNAPSGEALATGAFMIYGERKWYKKTPLNFAIGLKFENEFPIIISGPPSAIESQTKNFIELYQGDLSKSEAAKQLKKILENNEKTKVNLDLDEIISMLPSGGFKLLI